MVKISCIERDLRNIRFEAGDLDMEGEVTVSYLQAEHSEGSIWSTGYEGVIRGWVPEVDRGYATPDFCGEGGEFIEVVGHLFLIFIIY